MVVNRSGTYIVMIVLRANIFSHFFMVVLIPTGTITVGSVVVMAAEAWHLRTDILGNCSLIFCMGSGARWIRLFRHAGMGTDDNSLVITGEAGLVPVLLVENRSMPQCGMEDVCRVVVTMSDPMSHEFSPWVPHDFEELHRLGGVVCTLMVQVTMTSMSVQSLWLKKLPQGAFPQW